MKKTLISIKNASYFYYAEKHQEIGLNDISLDFYNDKNTLIVGESGSGKSTLLKLIAGQIKASKGLVLYPGIKKNEIFYLRDKKHVMLNKSLMQNALLYEDDEEHIEQIAKDLDVYDLLDVKINNLSGGEMDMVLIALSIVTKTSLVLLDEPFANVDDAWAKKTIEYINKVQNKTFVIISQKPYLFDKEKYRIVTIKDRKIEDIQDIVESKNSTDKELKEPSNSNLNRRTKYDLSHFVATFAIFIGMLLSAFLCIQNTTISMDRTIKNTKEFSTIIYKDNLDTFSYGDIDYIKSRYGAASVNLIPTSVRDARDTIRIGDKYFMDVSLSYDFNTTTSTDTNGHQTTTSEKGVLIQGREPVGKNEIGVTSNSGLSLGEEVSAEISYDDFITTSTMNLIVTGIYEESTLIQVSNYQDLFGKTIYVSSEFYSNEELFSLKTNFPFFTYWLDGYYVSTIGNFYNFDPENPTTQTLYVENYGEGIAKDYDFSKIYYLDVKYMTGAMMDFKIPVQLVHKSIDNVIGVMFENDVVHGVLGEKNTSISYEYAYETHTKAGSSVPLAASLIVTFGEGNEENIYRFYEEYMSKMNYSNYDDNSFGGIEDQDAAGIDLSLEGITYATRFDKLLYIVVVEIVLGSLLALVIVSKSKEITNWDLLEKKYMKRRRKIDLVLLLSLLVLSIIFGVVYYQFVYTLFKPMILISLLFICASFIPLIIYSAKKGFIKSN